MKNEHENKNPAQLWQVMSLARTKIFYLGKWVTAVLKDAATKFSTCTKNTDNLISHSRKLGTADNNECSCGASAKAMHPNTGTEEGIIVLLISCETNLVKHTKNLPTKKLMRTLHLLVQHSVFRFGKTCYRTKIVYPLELYQQ